VGLFSQLPFHEHSACLRSVAVAYKLVSNGRKAAPRSGRGQPEENPLASFGWSSRAFQKANIDDGFAGADT
jgi:hypothetical protein